MNVCTTVSNMKNFVMNRLRKFHFDLVGEALSYAYVLKNCSFSEIFIYVLVNIIFSLIVQKSFVRYTALLLVGQKKRYPYIIKD